MTNLIDIWCTLTDKNQIKAISLTSRFDSQCQVEFTPPNIDNFQTGFYLELADALPEEFGQWLINQIEQTETIILHICHNSDDNWLTTIPWEFLSHQGNSLRQYLLPIRHAFPPGKTQDRFSNQQRVLLIDLMSNEDWELSGLKLPNRPDQIINSHLMEIKQQDLSHYNSLVIFTHGTEDAQSLPFMLENGTHWDLPNRILPPFILLLACGDNDGNLRHYAKKLISHKQTEAVIVANGQLNLAQATHFYQYFIEGWQKGNSLDHLLHETHLSELKQVGKQTEHGAARLQLIGNGSIRSNKQTLTERNWPEKDLIIAAKTELLNEKPTIAFISLIERLTLKSYWNNQSPLWSLNSLLNIAFDSKKEQLRLLYALKIINDQLHLQSRYWVLALMTYLAERYDHSLLGWCSVNRAKLPNNIQPNYDVFFCWAHADYRNGHYPAAFQHLSKGLNDIKINPGQNHLKIIGFFLDLVNDLAMPKSGQAIIDILDDLLNSPVKQHNQTINIDRERFKFLDRKARHLIRQGDLIGATTTFKRKLQNGTDFGYLDCGNREHAWLLYVSTWCNSNEVNDYAKKVLQQIPDSKQINQSLLRGNSDLAYLIRASALWFWRNPKQSIKYKKQIDSTVLRLTDINMQRDTAPTGYAIAWLKLADLKKYNSHWPAFRINMESQHYYLELSSICYLLGENDFAQGYLKKFQNMRKKAIDSIDKLAEWLPQSLKKSSIFEEIEKRDQIEQNMIVKQEINIDKRIKLLVSNGLLPM
jgi:hypothetical protein